LIEIRKAKGKQKYYFVVRAKNGKILVTSETYARKASVIKAINAVDVVFLAQLGNIIDKTLKEKR